MLGGGWLARCARPAGQGGCAIGAVHAVEVVGAVVSAVERVVGLWLWLWLWLWLGLGLGFGVGVGVGTVMVVMKGGEGCIVGAG